MRRSKNLTGALTVGAAVFIAACGGVGSDGGDDDGGATTPTAPSLTETTAGSDQTETTEEDAPNSADVQLTYAKCMRENGVDWPDPSSDGGTQKVDLTGVDDETLAAAEKECESVLKDAYGEFELSPEDEAKKHDADLVFARCLRERGIEVPDPKPGEGMRIPIDEGKQDEMEEAMDACEDEAYGDLFKEAP